MPIHHSEQFGEPRALLALLGDDDGVFRYCEFKQLRVAGGHITATFMGCSFADVDWYWGLFNLSTIVRSKFERCTFRGTSFADSIFVECEFADCRFVKDDLGGECSFDGTRWYACIFTNCEGRNGVDSQ